MKLISKFKPKGDQPYAIKQLLDGLKENQKNQVLLGATGTGKTFTIANVIEKTQRTTIILSHNKTLAGQLYSELKNFFPNDRVEYFISNFDYYRPEAYIPSSDTYIDKTSKSNWDIEAMRMSTTNSLISTEKTIVIASVASIYGQLDPIEYEKSFMEIFVGQEFLKKEFLIQLVKRGYTRNNLENKAGTFRTKGDIIEISPSYDDSHILRIEENWNKIENIKKIDRLTGKILKSFNRTTIYPAKAYTIRFNIIKNAVEEIKIDLKNRLEYFKKNNKLLEAQRLEQRVLADIDSLLEYGTTTGIENYSRYFNNKKAGEKPYTILDYVVFNAERRGEKPLMIIDESHMMIPQLNAMYNGDRSRKENLVNYGFRLPSAYDNRPLKFKEFENEFSSFDRIYVSATPANYELNLTNGEIISQVVRPTGLLDPTVEIQSTKFQIENIFDRIQKQIKKKERTLILTITKRMAEELTLYLQGRNQKVAYIHSEHKTFQRDETIRKLRLGVYDVIVGINLLKEGIDIPEVSLILILDADKESFFRSEKSLIQIIGRASRNKNGHVVLYADKTTSSMKKAIEETKRRRKIQEEHNQKNNIEPKTIFKEIPEPLNPEQDSILNKIINFNSFENLKDLDLKDEHIKSIKKEIERTRGKMFKAAREMDFERAAQMRDFILELEILITK